MDLVQQINSLREKRAKLVEDARRTYEEAQKAGREFDGEERARWDAQIKDADKLKDEIRQLEALDAAERELIASDERRVAVSGKQTATADGKNKEDVDEARSRVFNAFLRGGPEEAERLLSSPEIRALQAHSDTIGGYTVAPPQFVSKLIKGVDDMLFFRGLATIIPVNGSEEIDGVSLDADPDDPDWTPEVGTIQFDSSMAFGKRNLKPYQLSKGIKVSKRLLRVSALDIDSLVASRIAYKFARTEENAYFNGTGAQQPLGIYVASAQGISTARDVTATSSTDIDLDVLKTAKYTLKNQHRAKARWIGHRDLAGRIAKKKDGEGRYYWQPGLKAGEPDTIDGIPFLDSELNPNTFTTGQYVACLANFADGYWIAEDQRFEFQRLVELYAGNGQIGFIGTRWLDGMPVLEEAFVRVKLA